MSLIKFEAEDAFLPSEPIDLTKVVGAYYTDEEIKNSLDRVPEEVKDDFRAHIFEASFWKHIEHKHVPFDFLKKRKGSKIAGTDEYKMLEYFPADYTTSELNRLFPGWWQEEMKLEVDYKLRTVRIMGYLCVEYPTLKGKKVTKRWATASTAIKISRDIDDKTNMFEASQPDDLEKSALTEWIKIAGKYFGIGLEIYSQRVTPELRSIFEDLVRDWGVYAEEVKKIAATIETGTGFRDFLRSLPSIEQTKRFINAVKWLPEGAAKEVNGEQVSIIRLSWLNFIKQRNDSEKNKLTLETFIQQMEQGALKIKQQKENNNNG